MGIFKRWEKRVSAEIASADAPKTSEVSAGSGVEDPDTKLAILQQKAEKEKTEKEKEKTTASADGENLPESFTVKVNRFTGKGIFEKKLDIPKDGGSLKCTGAKGGGTFQVLSCTGNTLRIQGSCPLREGNPECKDGTLQITWSGFDKPEKIKKERSVSVQIDDFEPSAIQLLSVQGQTDRADYSTSYDVGGKCTSKASGATISCSGSTISASSSGTASGFLQIKDVGDDTIREIPVFGSTTSPSAVKLVADTESEASRTLSFSPELKIRPECSKSDTLTALDYTCDTKNILLKAGKITDDKPQHGLLTISFPNSRRSETQRPTITIDIARNPQSGTTGTTGTTGPTGKAEIKIHVISPNEKGVLKFSYEFPAGDSADKRVIVLKKADGSKITQWSGSDLSDRQKQLQYPNKQGENKLPNGDYVLYAETKVGDLPAIATEFPITLMKDGTVTTKSSREVNADGGQGTHTGAQGGTQGAGNAGNAAGVDARTAETTLKLSASTPTSPGKTSGPAKIVYATLAFTPEGPALQAFVNGGTNYNKYKLELTATPGPFTVGKALNSIRLSLLRGTKEAIRRGATQAPADFLAHYLEKLYGSPGAASDWFNTPATPGPQTETIEGPIGPKERTKTEIFILMNEARAKKIFDLERVAGENGKLTFKLILTKSSGTKITYSTPAAPGITETQFFTGAFDKTPQLYASGSSISDGVYVLQETGMPIVKNGNKFLLSSAVTTKQIEILTAIKGSGTMNLEKTTVELAWTRTPSAPPWGSSTTKITLDASDKAQVQKVIDSAKKRLSQFNPQVAQGDVVLGKKIDSGKTYITFRTLDRSPKKPKEIKIVDSLHPSNVKGSIQEKEFYQAAYTDGRDVVIEVELIKFKQNIQDAVKDSEWPGELSLSFGQRYSRLKYQVRFG